MLQKTFTLWNCNREWKRWSILHKVYYRRKGEGKELQTTKCCLYHFCLTRKWLGSDNPGHSINQPPFLFSHWKKYVKPHTYPATQDRGVGSNARSIKYQNWNFIPYLCPTVLQRWERNIPVNFKNVLFKGWPMCSKQSNKKPLHFCGTLQTDSQALR